MREQGNGLSQWQKYDPAGRLFEQQISRPKAGAIESGVGIQHRYSYDKVGHLLDIGDSRRSNLSYRYDPVGRLLEANSRVGREIFAFDPAGNIVDAPPSGDPLRHPANKLLDNLLKSYAGTSYRYDERGNMTERLRNGWRTVFAWDGFNRMTAATDQSGITTTFSYDALGRRLSKSSGEATTLFGWDGDVLAFESTQSKSAIEEGGEHGWSVHYVHEANSFVPLVQVRRATAMTLSETTDAKALMQANGGVYDIEQDPLWNGEQRNVPRAFDRKEMAFYQCDHLGTPQELTDDEGSVAWSAQYKAWGEAKEAISEAGRRAGFRNPIRFQGQYWDEETGLHYNRYRYYDPLSGRFVSSDPIRLIGGSNLHAAVPNPTGWVDANGLSPAGILKKAGQVKAGRSVTVCSFKEASAVLFAAFPDAQKSAGAADKDPAKTARDKAAFKSNRQNGTGRASYHMDFKTNPATGVLYGHESLPDGHPHKTMPHVNVITPEGDRVDIFVDRPTQCPLAKKK